MSDSIPSTNQNVTYLSVTDLLSIVSKLGVGPVRDAGLLEAAVARPQTVLYAREVYESFETKVAVLLESVTRNHALVDGNKRLGWAASYVFCGLNGIVLRPSSDDDAYDLVVAVATGTLDYQEVVSVLAPWLHPKR